MFPPKDLKEVSDLSRPLIPMQTRTVNRPATAPQPPRDGHTPPQPTALLARGSRERSSLVITKRRSRFERFHSL